MELQRNTLRTGRNEMLSHVARRVRSSERVVDLGCGAGLLAQEAGRSDIVGVDMSPRMVEMAQRYMDVVVLDNILEHFPSEFFDAALLCNVLEPYAADMWAIMFKHVFEFLVPGGQIVVVVSVDTPSVDEAPASCVDLVFPTANSAGLRVDELEDELSIAGFDVSSPELLSTKTVNSAAAVPGDDPPVERRSYTVVVGRRPGSIVAGST